VKLIYAIAFAVCVAAAPLASAAQSPDQSLSQLCSDDYYDETAGQCGAVSIGEVLTIEAILAKYGVVIDGEITFLYFDDLDDMPVGSIRPRNEDAVPPEDEPANERVDTIASRTIIVDPLSETGGEAADDITTTGRTAQSIPVAAETADDNRTIEWRRDEGPLISTPIALAPSAAPHGFVVLLAAARWRSDRAARSSIGGFRPFAVRRSLP
jgi:hypothetical protein